jgi:dTDP-4-dehydrorhamnose reductase
MSLRILLLGRNGQLGWELERLLARTSELVATDRSELDLADPARIREIVRKVRPQVIVNAAAYSNVEHAESEAGLAHQVNAEAPAVLAQEAHDIHAALLHYSTDYVFDGDKRTPYVETDAAHPLNVYGRSKLEGERAVQQAGGAYLILRTSWVYSLRSNNFVTKLLGWAQTHPQLRVVTDQIANPTWCRALAEATGAMIGRMGADPAAWTRERRGVYHLAGGGHVNRFEFARAILEQLPHDFPVQTKALLPAVTSDFHDAAARPVFSALDGSLFANTFGIALPAWPASLRAAFADHFSQ